MKYITTTLLTVAFMFVTVFGAQAAHAQIIISAVQTTGGTGNTTNDFIELHNLSADPAGLEGLSLVKRTAGSTNNSNILFWDSEVLIPGNSFYLWAHEDFQSIAVTPDGTSSGTIASNSGIALINTESDLIIDSLSWGVTNNGLNTISDSNPGAHQSLQRIDLQDATKGFALVESDPRNSLVVFTPDSDEPSEEDRDDSDDSDIDEESDEEIDSDPDLTPEPESNYKTTSDRIKITEILPNPEGTDSGFERIELFNSDTETINLSGWFLDDVTENSELSSNKYQLEDVVISSGEYISITIPKGKFALNNSGNPVTLFNASVNPISSIDYANAEEGLSYANVEDEWYWLMPSFGAKNSIPEAIREEGFGLVVSEISTDTEFGGQWIEFYNPTESTISLSGGLLTSNIVLSEETSFMLLEDLVVGSEKSGVVFLEEDQFVLTNSSTNYLGLQNGFGSVVTEVVYQEIPEGRTWAHNRAGGLYELGYPTPQEQNIFVLPDFTVFISEIYPNPVSGFEEYVELYNASAISINAADILITVGEKEARLPQYELLPDSYFVVSQEDLPGQLVNSGKTIGLIDVYDREVDQVTYEESKRGWSYILTEKGDYKWSALPTRGHENVLLEAPEEVVSVSSVSKKTSANPPPAKLKTTKKSSTSSNPTKKTTTTSKKKSAAKKTTEKNQAASKNQTQKSVAGPKTAVAFEGGLQEDQKNTRKIGFIIAIGLLIVSGASFVVYKYDLLSELSGS